jgi:hypothetical protein
LRLIYPGNDLIRLKEGCDQLSFLDDHVKAFASYLGGMPRRVVSDPLSVAVKRLSAPNWNSPSASRLWLATTSSNRAFPVLARARTKMVLRQEVMI